jgi:hypothetical protein
VPFHFSTGADQQEQAWGRLDVQMVVCQIIYRSCISPYHSSEFVERLAPRYPPRASTAPHSLDGVLLPAYILRCLRCRFGGMVYAPTFCNQLRLLPVNQYIPNNGYDYLASQFLWVIHSNLLIASHFLPSKDRLEAVITIYAPPRCKFGSRAYVY